MKIGDVPASELESVLDCAKAMVESLRIIGWLFSNQNEDSWFGQINQSLQQQNIILEELRLQLRKDKPVKK